MTKPTMPIMPGFGAMTETLDFVKNMWGGMSGPAMGIPGMPGMVMPTLSVEDIDKQIKDLKAVESWLNVNMTMLRGTIQALEVQSATITTLKSMGETLTASVKQTSAAATSSTTPVFPFAFPATAAAVQPADTEPVVKSSPHAASETPSAADTESPFPSPLPNPAVWWNMLQDQFKQAVGTAMASEPTAAASKPKAKVKTSPAAAAAPRTRKAPPKAKSITPS